MAWLDTSEDVHHLCSHPLSISSIHAFQVLPLLVCLMHCFGILHMPPYFGHSAGPMSGRRGPPPALCPCFETEIQSVVIAHHE